MTNKQLEMLVFGALRYALGRKTYVVSEMCEFINSNLVELPKWMLEKIAKEIHYAIDNGNAGMYMDVIDWGSLAQDIEYYLETTTIDDNHFAEAGKKVMEKYAGALEGPKDR